MVDADLTGKTAIVTGAAGGIGQATARLLAHRGAQVVMVDRDADGVEAAAEAIGAKAFVCDQTDPADVDRLYREGIGDQLDICVANAGYGRFATFLDQDLASWQRHVDINLTGTFLICQGAARVMARDSGGAIVINGSTAALHSCALFGAYAASKAGVEMLARCMADELGPLKIRVNTVCPGVIDTAMTDGLLSAGNDAIRTIVETETPIGRVGRPEDVAEAIAYLASDAAAFVTGVALRVDGGETLRGFPRWFVPDNPAANSDPQWRLIKATAAGQASVGALLPSSPPEDAPR